MAVRVLYLEQLRLKSSLSGGGCDDGSFSQRVTCSGSGVPSSCVSPRRDNYASLRRENRELKLEVSRVRVRLTELEREQGLMKRRAGESGRAFLASLSRGIRRISMFRPAAAEEKRRKKSSQCSDGKKKSRRRKTASFAYD
jgi:hypothetical protein